MPAEVWKDREVAAAFLGERSLLIPDRQRQLEVLLRVLRFAPRQQLTLTLPRPVLGSQPQPARRASTRRPRCGSLLGSS
jgi:hypothetical protein